MRLRRATGSGQQALWANGRCDPSLVRLSDNLCFRTLFAFGRSSLSDTARWYRKKRQACSFLWYGTWDAPALVPNWSSFIFVVDVVRAFLSVFALKCSIFGGVFSRCFRWRTFLEGDSCARRHQRRAQRAADCYQHTITIKLF